MNWARRVLTNPRTPAFLRLARWPGPLGRAPGQGLFPAWPGPGGGQVLPPPGQAGGQPSFRPRPALCFPRARHPNALTRNVKEGPPRLLFTLTRSTEMAGMISQ
jgi:hypothetical protein